MFSFYPSKIFKAFGFFVLYFTLFQINIFGQTTFRITKPIIGTTQICSSSNNYYNSLSYAFSSDVVTNINGFPNSHYIELSNTNGYINPTNVGYCYASVNVIYSGSFVIGTLNLPAGGGYRIRIYTSSPSVYSDYSETFSVLENPTQPVLNMSGSVVLCPNTSQTLSVTNPNSSYTYQWQNNSTNIANATNTSYSAINSGSFSVKAISANGCSMISNSFYVSQTSALSGSLSINLLDNYYGGSLLFAQPNQAIALNVNFNGGKSPYSFTLNDETATITETNINYSKSYSLIAPLSGSRTYTIASITDGCGTQLTNTYKAKVRINASNYCSSSGQGSVVINNFSIQGTTISNLNSGKSADGWGEFLTPANINANVNYNFTIASGNSSQKYFAIWADLNQNNVFDSNEKIFPLSNTYFYYGQSITNSFTGVLKLPASTYNGQMRLRVQLGDDGWSVGNSGCSYLSNGEVEDYVLKVYNGIVPTTISTDSLPKFGICQRINFPVNFNVTGTAMPSNTTYRVEASNNADFSYPTTIGSGLSSPINSNISNFNSYNSRAYIRVVPVNNAANKIIKGAPNQLIIRTSPSMTLYGAIANPSYYAWWGDARKSFSIANTTPLTIFGQYNTSSSSPITVELDDGRIISSIPNLVFYIDTNKVFTSNKKYKIIRVSDNVCTNTTPDSVMISVGNPYLKISKVYKTYNDTTTISKLCGSFEVRFAGEYLDTLSYKFYHVQISDINGSFNNPQDIGHICVTRVFTEAQGGQEISCNIPSTLQLPTGTGYRLRVIKKTGNVISPVFSTSFELINSTIGVTTNLLRNVINEGEVTSMNVNFSGGSFPYRFYLGSQTSGQSYTTGSNSSISVNLAPVHGQKYTLSYSNSCGYNYNNSDQFTYLDVRTKDKENAQWYVKPIQIQPFYEVLKDIHLISNSDTLFKRPFSYATTLNGLINGYADFNSTNLQKPVVVIKTGETYSLFQTDNANNSLVGNLLTGIWIDSNQDGDFNDAGEELVKNTLAQHWNSSQTQSFTIPNNSNVGFSRIRIRVIGKESDAQPFDFNASNPIERRGSTYDIPIAILSNSTTGIISTPKLSGNTLCNGNSFNVDFSKYGIPSGMSASVELSDNLGNFSPTPTVIGQGTTSSINVTMPLTIPSGNYNIRIVSNGIISPISPTFNVSTNNLVSMVDGDWHAGSTWSCGRVPTVVDDVTVSTGTNITVFSGDARVGSLITNGVLSFLNGTQLKFRVP